MLALMFVHGQADAQPEPADLAVGIASYQQPAQVQPEWEAAAENCDGVVVEFSGQEHEVRELRHSGAAGLSFVALARAGPNRIMSSTDGQNWSAHQAPEQNNWYSVTYGDGCFVAVAHHSSRVTRSCE